MVILLLNRKDLTVFIIFFCCSFMHCFVNYLLWILDIKIPSKEKTHTWLNCWRMNDKIIREIDKKYIWNRKSVFHVIFLHNCLLFEVYLELYLFIGCPIGVYGINCTLPCRYPSFGNGCQRFCRCSQELCDNVSGCMVNQGHYVYFVWDSVIIGWDVALCKSDHMLTVRLIVVKYLHIFQFFLSNHWIDLNWILLKASTGKENSNYLRVMPFSLGNIMAT